MRGMTDNEKGFTLIELLAAMVILSVLLSVGFKKVENLSSVSEQKMLAQGIVELNTRESLIWFKVKLSHSGYSGDANLWSALDTNLSTGYIWEGVPTQAGGTLRFGNHTTLLNRIVSEPDHPGQWSL
jgi:prepilin-type N-terminal cleavage/methylation domain-containing protein